jgi:hypothetical protein
VVQTEARLARGHERRTLRGTAGFSRRRVLVTLVDDVGAIWDWEASAVKIGARRGESLGGWAERVNRVATRVDAWTRGDEGGGLTRVELGGRTTRTTRTLPRPVYAISGLFSPVLTSSAVPLFKLCSLLFLIVSSHGWDTCKGQLHHPNTNTNCHIDAY